MPDDEDDEDDGDDGDDEDDGVEGDGEDGEDEGDGGPDAEGVVVDGWAGVLVDDPSVALAGELVEVW